MAHVVPQWAAATARAAPNAYRNVAMFLDGTLRPTCMPCPKEPPPGVTQYELQRAQYTRHKKRHGFKMHALVAPCGIATHWHGPCDGRRHDMFILTDSGIVPRLQGLTIGNVDYMVYADSAYPVMRNLMCPVPRINAPPGSRAARLNATMAAARTVASEIYYGITTNKFQSVDFDRWQRQYLTAPALQYHISLLLINCHTCLNGHNKISDYFDCTPPSLHTYLSGSY